MCHQSITEIGHNTGPRRPSCPNPITGGAESKVLSNGGSCGVNNDERGVRRVRILHPLIKTLYLRVEGSVSRAKLPIVHNYRGDCPPSTFTEDFSEQNQVRGIQQDRWLRIFRTNHIASLRDFVPIGITPNNEHRILPAVRRILAVSPSATVVVSKRIAHRVLMVGIPVNRVGIIPRPHRKVGISRHQHRRGHQTTRPAATLRQPSAPLQRRPGRVTALCLWKRFWHRRLLVHPPVQPVALPPRIEPAFLWSE